MLLDDLHITAEQLKEGMVVAVDKPRQWSSFQLVNKLKWQIKRRLGVKKFKIGHAGTLDPLASGLMLICIGPATKQIATLQEGTKRYTGTMVLGATTPCYDLERAVDAYYPVAQLDAARIENARQHFLGTQQQVPPHFSAVKVNGQRAYMAARHEEEQELKAKEVTIYRFELSNYRPGCYCWQSPSLGLPGFVPGTTPTCYGSNAHSEEIATNNTDKATGTELYRHPQGIVPDWLPQVDFEVECSKGTYIRSLARDFGEALESGAFLCALRRTQIGSYTIDDAYTIE